MEAKPRGLTKLCDFGNTFLVLALTLFIFFLLALLLSIYPNDGKPYKLKINESFYIILSDFLLIIIDEHLLLLTKIKHGHK